MWDIRIRLNQNPVVTNLENNYKLYYASRKHEHSYWSSSPENLKCFLTLSNITEKCCLYDINTIKLVLGIILITTITITSGAGGAVCCN